MVNSFHSFMLCTIMDSIKNVKLISNETSGIMNRTTVIEQCKPIVIKTIRNITPSYPSGTPL